MTVINYSKWDKKLLRSTVILQKERKGKERAVEVVGESKLLSVEGMRTPEKSTLETPNVILIQT